MNRELFFSTIVFLIIALIMAVAFSGQPLSEDNTAAVTSTEYSEAAVLDQETEEVHSDILNEKDKETDSNKTYLALIMDDIGYGKENKYNIFERLYGFKITFSIIPGTFNAVKAEETAVNSGFEVMAHLPMQAKGIDNSYEKAIRTDMSHEALYNRIEEMFSNFKYVKGANNHMGSKATSDKKTMLTLMTYLKKRNMFFVDSLTTSDSVVKEVAGLLEMDYLARNIFIDNQTKTEYIKKQLEAACRIANKKKVAIAICHVRENTINVLESDLQKILDKYDVELINVSELYVNKKKFNMVAR